MAKKKRSRAEQSKDWRAAHPDHCRRYYKKYREEHRSERNKYKKLYCTQNPDKVRRWRLTKYRKLRDEVYAHYGGYICACCGETTREFLTIDHIDGNGNEHRRSIGIGKAGSKFYYWLKKNNYPSGFQILCFNCNCGRERNKGICPHKAAKPMLTVKAVIKPFARIYQGGKEIEQAHIELRAITL